MSAEKREFVSVKEAAAILRLSEFRLSQLCRQGVFKTAFKPGKVVKAHWRISRYELLAHLYNSHVAHRAIKKSRPEARLALRDGSNS